MKKLLLLTTIFSMATFTAVNGKTLPTRRISFKEPLTKVDSHRKVTFLEDADHKKFIAKWNDADSAVRETIATKIIKSTGVNINDVELLSSNDPIKNELFGTNRVTATLHTHVQSEMIHNISHKDLCAIAAANSYVNNGDTHSGNLFFDRKTNTFHAIDMDRAFMHEYARATNICNCVKKLENEDLSLQEIKSLKRFDKTLEKLIHEYPSTRIFNEWMGLMKQTDDRYNALQRDRIKSRIEHNVTENKRLQSTITTVLKSQNPMSYAFKRAAEPSKKAQYDFWRTMNS